MPADDENSSCAGDSSPAWPSFWLFRAPPFRPMWRIFEDLAHEVNRVTPSDGLVYAPEAVLFAARGFPPPGMENGFGNVLRLPPDQLARLHILPQSQIDSWLAAGDFDTVMIWTTDPRVQSLGLLRRYARREQLLHYYILSDPIKDSGQPESRR